MLLQRRSRFLVESGLLGLVFLLLVLAIVVCFVSMGPVYYVYRQQELAKGRLSAPYSHIEIVYTLVGLIAVFTGILAIVYRTLLLFDWITPIRYEMSYVDFDHWTGIALTAAGGLLWFLTAAIFRRKS